jgi:hypothetical protein
MPQQAVGVEQGRLDLRDADAVVQSAENLEALYFPRCRAVPALGGDGAPNMRHGNISGIAGRG